MNPDAANLDDLQGAHSRLRDVRTDLKVAAALLEDPALGDAARTFIVNVLEPAMWRVEAAIRDRRRPPVTAQPSRDYRTDSRTLDSPGYER